MPQPTRHDPPDPYLDAYHPRSELPSLSEIDSDETSSSINYSEELDLELAPTQEAISSTSTRTAPVRTSLSSLYVDETLSAVVDDNTSGASNSGFAEITPLLLTVVALDESIENPRSYRSLPRRRGFSNVDSGLSYQYPRFIGSVPRPPTPPINSSLLSHDTFNLPPNFTVEVINSDGFTLSVAAPTRLTTRADLDPTGAVPLSRQNALRIKRQRIGDNFDSTQRITSSHRDFQKLLKNIDETPIYENMIPFKMYSNESDVTFRCLLPFERNTLPKLKKLDRFLRKRRRHYDYMDRMLRAIPESRIAARSFKREAEDHIEASSKRRRLARSSEKPIQETMTSNNLMVAGLSIQEKFVPPMDEKCILDGLFCSYVSDGSAFHIPRVETTEHTLNMDLRLFRVDYQNKRLAGSLVFNEQESGTTAITNLMSFLAFLGGTNFRPKRETQVLFKKRLSNLIYMLQTICEKSNDRALLDLAKNVSIPISGDIVDFKKNDLRFVKKAYGSTMYPRSVLHTEEDDIEFDLLQWLQIKPISNFAEAKFYEVIVNGEKYLKLLIDHPKEKESDKLRFVQGFHDLLKDICKVHGFIEDTKIPFTSEDCRRSGNKWGFLKTWNYKLSEDICQHLATEKKNLTNIQLNYVLFTMELDISKVLETLFDKALALIEDEAESQLYQKMYADVGEPDKSALSRKVVLVCSVNRKNGQLHIHNTRPKFDYRMMEFLDNIRFKDYHDPIFKVYAATIMTRLDSRGFLLDDPDKGNVPTKLKGYWQRKSGGSIASNAKSVAGNYSVA